MNRTLMAACLCACTACADPAIPEDTATASVRQLMTSEPVRQFAAEKVEWEKLGRMMWTNVPEPEEFLRCISLGADAVPALLELLGSEDRDVPVASWLALAKITNRDFGSLYPLAWLIG